MQLKGMNFIDPVMKTFHDRSVNRDSQMPVIINNYSPMLPVNLSKDFWFNYQ